MAVPAAAVEDRNCWDRWVSLAQVDREEEEDEAVRPVDRRRRGRTSR